MERLLPFIVLLAVCVLSSVSGKRFSGSVWTPGMRGDMGGYDGGHGITPHVLLAFFALVLCVQRTDPCGTPGFVGWRPVVFIRILLCFNDESE